MHWFLKFIFGMRLHMFRTVPLSIIRSFSLYTQQWYMSYRFSDSLREGSGPLLFVQWKALDDGQRNCPKHIEFYSKNKFEKLVHLVDFIKRIYHVAQSPERQITADVRNSCMYVCMYVWSNASRYRELKCVYTFSSIAYWLAMTVKTCTSVYYYVIHVYMLLFVELFPCWYFSCFSVCNIFSSFRISAYSVWYCVAVILIIRSIKVYLG